jgi:hypothetical protein
MYSGASLGCAVHRAAAVAIRPFASRSHSAHQFQGW